MYSLDLSIVCGFNPCIFVCLNILRYEKHIIKESLILILEWLKYKDVQYENLNPFFFRNLILEFHSRRRHFNLGCFVSPRL